MIYCYSCRGSGGGGGQQENFADGVEHNNILADNTPVTPADTQITLPLYK